MSAQDAKEALDLENKLLAEIEAIAVAYSKHATGTAIQIVNGWAGSFRAHRQFNEELISADADLFARRIEEEADVLRALYAAVSDLPNEAAASWKAMFEEDLTILNQLR